MFFRRIADLPQSRTKRVGISYRHIVDNITATLIIHKVGTYRDIMEMDLESVLLTYATLYINSLNEIEASKVIKK